MYKSRESSAGTLDLCVNGAKLNLSLRRRYE